MLKTIRRLLIPVLVCLTVFLFWNMYKEKKTEGSKTPKEQRTESVNMSEGEMPDAYDCRENGKAPSVKNQGDAEICWATAAAAALESRLLPKQNVSFSAQHIVESSGCTDQEAGTALMAAACFVSWKDPVADGWDGSSQTAKICHVQEVQMLLERDDRKIKQLIYQYGAVQCSMYMDKEDQAISASYQTAVPAYCYTGTASCNHDVLLLGWDDHYPAENFASDPGRDGAFICQNSWGSDFGEDGVFYVSYGDSRIGTNCAVCTRVDAADNYDHIYQTDLCGWVGQAGYGNEACQFANVYTAKKQEVLRAVGFYAVGKDTEYKIKVAPDFQNAFSLILAEEIGNGRFENPGYYTVDLKEPVCLEKGQKFAVVVEIHTPDEKYPAAIEYSGDLGTQNVILDDGEGYISPDGYRWVDVEEQYQGNVCLKAYTDDESSGKEMRNGKKNYICYGK